MKIIRVMLAVALLLTALLSWAGEPRGWRGDGTGEYPAANPPTEWAKDKNVVWSTPIAQWSNSSPILVGDKLFVCAEPNSLLCLGAADGKIIWQKSNGPTDLATAEEQQMKVPSWHPEMGGSVQTPVSDGVHVWALFASGIATCFTVDGERVWTKQLRVPTRSAWGFDASPVLADGKLIIAYGDIIAYDPLTGAQLWQAKSAPHWGSPVLTKIGDVSVLVTTNGEIIRISDGIVLATGLCAPEHSSPIVHNGVVYAMRSGTETDMISAWQLPAKVENDAVVVNKLWDCTVPKQRYYASPLFYDGNVYVVNQAGMLSAINATTGQSLNKWPAKLQNMGGGTYYPSPVSAGKYVYVSSGSTVLVLDPAKDFAEIARNPIDGTFRSNLIFAGERMYVRSLTGMICIGK